MSKYIIFYINRTIFRMKRPLELRGLFQFHDRSLFVEYRAANALSYATTAPMGPNRLI